MLCKRGTDHKKLFIVIMVIIKQRPILIDKNTFIALVGCFFPDGTF